MRSSEKTMTIRFTAAFILFSILVLTGCNGSDRTPPPATGGQSHPLAITLGPQSSTYSIDDVFKGDIQFAVSIENKADEGIIFGHPTICFPEDHRIGDSLDLTEYHGKSEILLTVEKPDGSVAVLRDGPHFFDPAKESHFAIEPGQSNLFYLGWFFQNARGGWENDTKAENVFTGRGEYRLKVLYRNFFPKALVRDAASEKSRFIDVWTGEVESNTIVVTIQ
jgi:hypothetical protein